MTSQLIQKARETLEKMKKVHKEFECNGANNGKGCYECFCEDQNCRNAPKEYNQAISDVQSLLPQIITGVIEEIEKKVEERYPESFATREVGDHREFMRGKRFPEYVTILLGEEKEAVEWFLSILKEVVKESN